MVNFGNTSDLFSPSGVVDNWRSMDEGHHQALIQCNLTKAGVGYRNRDNPGWRTNGGFDWQNYWTVDFIQ